MIRTYRCFKKWFIHILRIWRTSLFQQIWLAVKISVVINLVPRQRIKLYPQYTQLWLAGGFKQTLAFAWYGNSGSSPWTIIVEVSTIKEMMYNLKQKTWAYSDSKTHQIMLNLIEQLIQQTIFRHQFIFFKRYLLTTRLTVGCTKTWTL